MAESCNRLEMQARTTNNNSNNDDDHNYNYKFGITHTHTHMIAGTPPEPPHISCLLKFACTFGPENDCRAAAQVLPV